MGRPKSRNKDMPDGMYQSRANWYWRGTSKATRAIALRLFGKLSASSGTADKAAARAWWAKIILPALEQDFASAAETNTIKHLVERWAIEELPNIHNKNTREFYASLHVGILRELGDRKFLRTDAEAQRVAHDDQYATRRALQQYIRSGRQVSTFIRKDGKPQTGTREKIVNREMKHLAQIFRDADRLWGETNYNPAADLSFNAEPPRQNYHDDTAYLRVYDAAAHELQCMMDIQLATGARPGMVRALNVDDIEGGFLYVLPNKIRSDQMPRTREARRNAQKPYQLTNDDGTPNDLSRAIERALTLRKARRGSGNVLKLPSEQPLILNQLGERWTKDGHRSAWERACKNAGIDPKDFHKHDIRAKTVSDSETIEIAQERAGHTDSAITRRVYKRKQNPVQPMGLPKQVKR